MSAFSRRQGAGRHWRNSHCNPWGGNSNDKPVVGDWNGDGKTKIGIYRAGTWYLDANGSGVFDGCGVDRCASFDGDPTDQAVVGRW